jgi:hypothetical protein
MTAASAREGMTVKSIARMLLLMVIAPLRGWGAFGLHQPSFDQFPFQIWSQLVSRHSRNSKANILHHIDPLGLVIME